MDQRYYGFMPLHPFVLAAVFRVLGPGLAQARLETVALTALTLALTFGLGWRLFGAWVGALAVALLVLVRWTGLTYVQLTGIPAVDFARIARYDPLVPAIGLGALDVYLSARARHGPSLYLLAECWRVWPVWPTCTACSGCRRSCSWRHGTVVCARPPG